MGHRPKSRAGLHMDELFLLAVDADNGHDAIWLLQLWLGHIDRPRHNPASPESARQSLAAREAFHKRSNLGGRRAFLFQIGQSYRDEAFGEFDNLQMPEWVLFHDFGSSQIAGYLFSVSFERLCYKFLGAESNRQSQAEDDSPK